jgi:glycosyltransferase involved in cell wall biosynthesis
MSSAALSVLMFCPQYLPKMGGTERQAAKLSKALAEMGCRVRILTPAVSGLPNREVTDGFEVIRFPLQDLSKRLPFKGIGLLNVPVMNLQVQTAMKRFAFDFDVVHCHSAGLVSAMACASAKTMRKPSLVKVASSTPTELEALQQRPIYESVFVRGYFRSQAQFICISDHISSELSEIGISSDRINKIPNGVAIPDGVKPRSARTKFLYLGRLDTNTSRDTAGLLVSFAHVYPSNRAIELALVGGGNLLEATRAHARNLTEADPGLKIHVPGFDSAEKWFAWADAFVLPSRHEGLSNALLEAMAHGLPCIANDIPPNREALADGESGILVPVGNRRALADALASLVRDPGLARHLSAKARERVEQVYSIEVVAQKVMDLYGKCINDPESAYGHAG